jgi:hypothetical protein
MSDRQTYKVLSEVSLLDTVYQKDALVDLTAEQAAAPLAAGQVELKAPAPEAPAAPATPPAA